MAIGIVGVRAEAATAETAFDNLVAEVKLLNLKMDDGDVIVKKDLVVSNAHSSVVYRFVATWERR